MTVSCLDSSTCTLCMRAGTISFKPFQYTVAADIHVLSKSQKAFKENSQYYKFCDSLYFCWDQLAGSVHHAHLPFRRCRFNGNPSAPEILLPLLPGLGSSRGSGSLISGAAPALVMAEINTKEAP